MSDPDVHGPDPGAELPGAVQLVDFPAQGYEYEGQLHGLSGTLHAWSGPPAWLEARILLPVSHGDRSVGAHCHVLRADHLLSLLPAVDGLDVMQHNRMPHWTGHCALLDGDIAAALRINVALCQAKADFIQRCFDALHGRRDLLDLWR